MADTRKGTCKDCGAEYQIPANFPHDKAKCRECGGVVEIQPAAGADEPAAPPVPAAEPPAKEAAPAAEPGEKPMTMKEKIIARKKAEAAAAKQAEATPAKKAAPAKKAGGGKRAAGAKAGAKTGKKAGKKAGGRKAAGAKGRRRRGGDADEDGGRRGRRGAAKAEKKPPVGGMIAIAVLVVGGGAGWYFTMGPGADEPTENPTVAENDDTTEPGQDAEATLVEAGAGAEEAPAGGDEPSTPDASAADEGGADEGTEPAAADPEPEPEPEKPAEKTYDPDSVDLLGLEDYGPAYATTDEEWGEIQELMSTFLDMDAGARQGRAGRTLLSDYGYKAMPAYLNAMSKFDYGMNEGYRMGEMIQRDMTTLLNGRNFDWDSDLVDDVPTPRSHYRNKRIVVAWRFQWDKVVEDPAYWIELAKLTSDGREQQLQAYRDILGDLAPEEEEDLGLDDF